MPNKIKFGTQCDEETLIAVKDQVNRMPGYFLSDAIEDGLKLWLQQRTGAAIAKVEPRKPTVFDELMDIDPDSAAEFVPLLRREVKRAKELLNARPTAIVPAEEKTRTSASNRKKTAG